MQEKRFLNKPLSKVVSATDENKVQAWDEWIEEFGAFTLTDEAVQMLLLFRMQENK